MNNLIVSLKVIAPLMIYMLMGVALKKSGKLPEKLNNDINKLLVSVFLPFLMFKNIYNADLSGISGGFGLYAGLATVIGWFVCFGFCSLVEKDPAKVGSMVQGMFRSNAVIFGIPVAENLFGVGNTVEVALALAVCVPVYNVLSVVILEICGQKARIAKGKAEAGKTKVNVKSILVGIAKNKLIWGALLGILVNMLHIDLPETLDTVVAGMSGVITPLAFITLGASFSLKSAKENRRDLVLVTAVKLVIYPMIYMLLPLHWGWTGHILGAMLLTSASPTAISSYPMAKAMGCDGDLAGEIVVVTSIFSILTIFLWIFGLKQFGLL